MASPERSPQPLISKRDKRIALGSGFLLGFIALTVAFTAGSDTKTFEEAEKKADQEIAKLNQD